MDKFNEEIVEEFTATYTEKLQSMKHELYELGNDRSTPVSPEERGDP